MTQPAYWKLNVKCVARRENVALYQRLTGRFSIPAGRTYWTLCNYQPPYEEGTEIVQLEKMGFLQKNQFVGVDLDEEVIDQNSKWHPETTWHRGDWSDVISEQDCFNPAMVYLDTVGMASSENTIALVSSTMYLCPVDTVLLVNTMLNNPRNGDKADPKELILRLSKRVGSLELSRWSSSISNFNYSATNRTNMMTYAFHKER